MPSITTRGFELAAWQRKAVESWREGDDRGPFRGTLEVFTGGGKTLIALAAMRVASEETDQMKAVVVVPTEALAHQWIAVLREKTDLEDDEVGLMGAGSTDDLSQVRVLVAVINTAANRLGGGLSPYDPKRLMLIIDECHRAGAPRFQRILDLPARFRLGLSATPDREELDAEGEPLEYDDQVLGQKLGQIVFSFDLAKARAAGWLPEYRLTHHGVQLQPVERERYDRLSRRIDDLADQLRESTGSIDPRRARQIAGSGGEGAQSAQAWLSATAERKDLLFRARERERIAVSLALEADKGGARSLIFHERVDEAKRIFDRLHSDLGSRVGLEHSRLPGKQRRLMLERFRSGEVTVLVSVKSLVEGIDVPAADVGISVAASSSVRQRVQTLGRVLRKADGRKLARMELIYVTGTVDELIYGKEDWSELTGPAANTYLLWPLDPELPPDVRPGPPLSPRPTEQQEWDRLGRTAPESPVEWRGEIPDLEYSVDTRGTVRNAQGVVIENPQDVSEWIERVRGRPGGRFRVSPVHGLVLVSEGGGPRYFVVGRLKERFRTKVSAPASNVVDLAGLNPGDVYLGPIDEKNGKFRLRSRGGGVIERRVDARTWEMAETSGDDSRAANGRTVIANWKSCGGRGTDFAVNSLCHAYYYDRGEARFLGAVDGGFLWHDEGGVQ